MRKLQELCCHFGELIRIRTSISDRGLAPSEMSLIDKKQRKVSWQKSRKGQAEILGLVLIVLLISIGILIAIIIFSRPVGQEIRYEQESLFAANFLSTMVKSDSDCRGRSIGELLQNCAETKGAGGVVCDNGRDSCTQANFLIDNLLEGILSKQGIDFYFTIKDRNDNVVEGLEDFVFGRECRGEFESKTRPLVFLGGEIYLKLDLCR